MAIGLTEVFEDPAGVAAELERRLPAPRAVVVERKTPGKVVFRITLFPEGVFARDGYPVEVARVFVFVDGRVLAMPASAPGRTWEHRETVGFGPLCLCYPDDPPEYRWCWDEGLEEYVRILHRHLIYEEFYRREGWWPVEDAPHGNPSMGRWPIKSDGMRRLGRRRKR